MVLRPASARGLLACVARRAVAERECTASAGLVRRLGTAGRARDVPWSSALRPRTWEHGGIGERGLAGRDATAPRGFKTVKKSTGVCIFYYYPYRIAHLIPAWYPRSVGLMMWHGRATTQLLTLQTAAHAASGNPVLCDGRVSYTLLRI